MLGIGDVAVAGELVALVAVLAAALAVALPGDRGDTAPRLTELAGGQTEVDRRDHVVDALGVLLDASGVEQHAGGGRAPQLGDLLDPRCVDARDIGCPARCHGGDGCGCLVESGGVGVDEGVVEPVVTDQLVEHGPEQAESVPGRTPRNTSAVRANGTTRGSWTISLAPRSRPARCSSW